VLRKGYGLAEVELAVPIQPGMVFRVGSVTKQFTSACILKLAEQGRLALDDPISKYFPDYPAGGRAVTIAQLLTHTSGVRSYTDMPAWYPHMREDWTLAQLVDFFKGEPLDFAPGTKWHYDNSGYILLGAILEKVSGESYADFVSETIFRPLEMKDTRYGADTAVIPGRVAGYEKGPAGIVNARFLSMTQPFSAGGLVSTVDDLARWQAALDAGEVLTDASRRKMWTPVSLPDGTSTRYGFGWIVWTYEGHPVVEHGGRINGFESANLRLQEDHVYVAVLSNCAGCADTRALALGAASLLAGKPMADRTAVALATALLDRYAGTYRDDDGDDWIVTRKDDHLLVAAGRRSWEAWPSSQRDFFLRDSVRTMSFVEGARGAITAMRIDERVGPVETAVRVEK
jgi:D-alanyl-D-alanine carboxypeptidase